MNKSNWNLNKPELLQLNANFELKHTVNWLLFVSKKISQISNSIVAKIMPVQINLTISTAVMTTRQLWLLLHYSVLTDMKTGLIIVGAVLAAVALCDARSPPRPQVCTADWKPVCGVDNKTYGNVCMAKAKYVDIYIYKQY